MAKIWYSFIHMGAAEHKDGLSQVQMTAVFFSSIIETMSAFAWLTWPLLGLVSVVPKIKENVLNARYLW